MHHNFLPDALFTRYPGLLDELGPAAIALVLQVEADRTRVPMQVLHIPAIAFSAQEVASRALRMRFNPDHIRPARSPRVALHRWGPPVPV